MSELEEISDPRGPLEGVTVIDFTVNIAGPCATLALADLGARVLKIEPPGGDASREWSPQSNGVATVFSAFNRGKESIVIDAKRPEGRRLLHRLIADADVFVESMRPGKADALGIGWEDLRAINDRLVYCSISAFGDKGPMIGVAGFDAVIQAYSGLMDLTGYPDGEPARVGGAVIDVGTGAWAALGIVTALLQREHDGRGRRVSMTMLGTAVGYLMHHLTSVRVAGVEPTRLGTAQHNFAPYQAVRAADRMVMVGINSDAMWRRGATAIGAPNLAHDARFATNSARVDHRDELIAAIEEATQRLPADDLVSRLIDAKVPASAVRPIGLLADDPQLDALGLWGMTPDGDALPRTPVGDPSREIGAVAEAGEHTRSILDEIGIDEDEIEALLGTEVVAEGRARALGSERT